MLTITVLCPHCGSNELVRNGRAPNGKQKYLCRSCQRQSRENPTPHAYPEARREEILRAYEERSSLCGLERTFGVSRNTVITWIKKSRSTASIGVPTFSPSKIPSKQAGIPAKEERAIFSGEQ